MYYIYWVLYKRLSVILDKHMLMYPTVYRIDMPQKNGKESLDHFVEREVKASRETIKGLIQHSQSSHANGLTLADAGSKISTEEGKLEILRMVDYLIDDKKNW